MWAYPYLVEQQNLKLKIMMNSSIDVVHSAYTSNSDIMRSYHESISMQLNDETYLMSNNIIIIDIGQGYHIMSEAYNVNNKQDMSLSLLSPDERVIGLDFYNTKDFMLPSELVAKNDPFVKKTARNSAF